MKGGAINITIIPIEGIIKKTSEGLLLLFRVENKQENHTKNTWQASSKKLTELVIPWQQLSSISFPMDQTVGLV